MITRELYNFLENWKKSKTRKPLILQGARQVGKTTLVHEFGKSYAQYLYFNIEKESDAKLFQDLTNLNSVVELLFISRNCIHDLKKPTLIFIDEIQENPKIIEKLRYLYEDFSHLHIIVSGSLLQFGLDQIMQVPVGRVNFASLHPLNFKEFLIALGHSTVSDLLNITPLPDHTQEIIFDLFHQYAMIGGMPEIVNTYLKEKTISSVLHLYSDLLKAYKNDIEKYGQNNSQKNILRHIMDTAPYEIDKRIILNNFGNSSFTTREIKEALLLLQKAFILQIIYPTTHTALPLSPDLNKRPRLCYLDIGLVNYHLKLHKELLITKDLNDTYRGQLIPQLILQELRSLKQLDEFNLPFWVREEKGTSSEVDLIYSYKNMAIPVEIKAGATGTLRSLHEYMDRCRHVYAVRFYRGPIIQNELFTRNGKKYNLLNLPYYLAYRLDNYLDWFVKDFE